MAKTVSANSRKLI